MPAGPTTNHADGEDAESLMTTAEVARLLRVKERKIYDLVADDAIPHTKVTGKLLFPRALIDAWLRTGTSAGPGRSADAASRPMIAAGSHDPLLEWALAESGCGIAPLFGGSLDGAERYRRGEALFAGVHVPGDPDGDRLPVPPEGPAGRSYNRPVLASVAEDVAAAQLVTWAERVQGLILAPAAETVRGLTGLAQAGVTVKRRQGAAGSRVLLDRLLAAEGLAETDIRWSAEPAMTETEAALALLDGEAAASFGIQAVAQRFNLPFVPLARERYDLLVEPADYFAEPFQQLLRFTRSDGFADRARALGGYDIRGCGTVPPAP